MGWVFPDRHLQRVILIQERGIISLIAGWGDQCNQCIKNKKFKLNNMENTFKFHWCTLFSSYLLLII